VKKPAYILLLVILCPLSEVAQLKGPQPGLVQQQPNTDDARLKAQRRYDPMAGQKHMQDGPLDGLLDSINPANTDYGARLADGRTWFVGSTIEDLYFWIVVGEGAAITFVVLYVFWLFRERGNRLEIAVNIVTQLANSYLYTRSRALDAIRRHNHVVDDYNAIAEKLAKHEALQQKVVNSIAGSADPEKATETPRRPMMPPTTTDTADLSPNVKSNSAEEQQPLFPAQPEPSMTKEQIKKLVEEAKRTAAVGAKQQVSALTQQVRNLREQLNQALAEIQRLEKQNRTSVGA